ncbi:putative TIR domain, winged helix-turn-helix DNA-binding domain-containing protein [Medicago truncatula]|uniref:Disease resistance protein (TIR-NBS-LRR class), putative n=1 Tax=Medicago truncatula TaxID=3880 RepID=G7KIG1_MEDTR|nr:disease resistance protein RUN1 [Medicago truncatula]AES76181.2 disease resistance protein (TIR-NBS-LRR class), putative [Medicago truncatula]RHN52365.1 putative TIR domain, winged helix-turn-helix DNA-binding domain-containing protein [Medicago truncatula]
MAVQSPSSSSSLSSSSCNNFNYDVFISFRGTDTRFSFTGNLYKALSDNGIRTFIDDKDLQSGDEITPSLLKNIEDSRISILVFSENYATSSFCLDELVHIIHCSKEKGSMVIPVFYGIEPSHVRHQNSSYGEALAKHEEVFQNNKESMERLRKWKKALNHAANLSGHHFNFGNEYEHHFIGKIVKDVSNKINHVPLHVADYLVGLKSRISEVNSLLELESNDGVWKIGILGTGGMGKTTLAQAVYNSIADQFECKCFLHDVRENSLKHGLEFLQEQLLSKSIRFETKFGHVNEGIPVIKRRLSQKKVLLILNDVDKLNQLENLVGEPGWLGHGSRVIITTRDKCLLSSHGIKKIYEAYGLNKEQALELVRTKTFKCNKTDASYDYILNRAVKYASGLPLALEVVGSNLFGKSIEECESTLDKYERIPHADIQKILRISYDSLDEEQQSVFLDIACFFKWHEKEYTQELLHGHYGYCIKSHIGVLVDKSLIKFNSDPNVSEFLAVTLHDLIEDMGKEIVRQESIKEPGRRSRLWCCDDIVHVLQENTGSSKIEMIILKYRPSTEPVIDMNEKAFKKMTNLKTLIVEDDNFSKGPKYLPSSLRVLEWSGFTSESLSCFSNKKFNNIKNLTLDGSKYLTHISDVSGLPNLEKLSFHCCHSLITIHNSIGYLIKLEILDAWGCNKLESFPPLQLPSLKELILSRCSSLKNFPELLCKMTNIEEIELHRTSIGELPSSFKNLSELRHLSISFVNLKILPECLSECHRLRELVLYGCNFLEEIRGIPPNLNYLSAIDCKSLSSSSRRMLLSQQLHDAGCTNIILPSGTEGIPDWFEHQSRENTISFWFRKKIPSITCIIIVPDYVVHEKFLFLNGKEITLTDRLFYYVDHDDDVVIWGHAFLFDLKLEQRINESFANETDELYEAFKNNEWNHVELKCKIYGRNDWSDTEEDEEEINILGSDEKEIKIGIHVSWKEKSNTEGDVVFTNPSSRKRKLDEYLFNYSNTSLSQFVPPLKKQRLMEVRVSETEEDADYFSKQFLIGMH